MIPISVRVCFLVTVFCGRGRIGHKRGRNLALVNLQYIPQIYWEVLDASILREVQVLKRDEQYPGHHYEEWQARYPGYLPCM